MTGEEETFLSVGLVIEKQQFDSFNEVQLSKEAKEELMDPLRLACAERTGKTRRGSRSRHGAGALAEGSLCAGMYLCR